MVLHPNYAQKCCPKTSAPIQTPQISAGKFTWQTHMANKNFAQHLTTRTVQHPIHLTDTHIHIPNHTPTTTDLHPQLHHIANTHLLHITTHVATIDVPDPYPNHDIPIDSPRPLLIPTVTMITVPEAQTYIPHPPNPIPSNHIPNIITEVHHPEAVTKANVFSAEEAATHRPDYCLRSCSNIVGIDDEEKHRRCFEDSAL